MQVESETFVIWAIGWDSFGILYVCWTADGRDTRNVCFMWPAMLV